MASSRDQRDAGIRDHGTAAGKLCSFGLRSPTPSLGTSGASGPSSILEPPPLDHSRTGSNPPRTTTSLLALVSSCHQLGKIKPSGKKTTNSLGRTRIRNVTELDPSPGKRITFGWRLELGSDLAGIQVSPSPNTLRHSGILWNVQRRLGSAAAGPGEHPIGPTPADRSSVAKLLRQPHHLLIDPPPKLLLRAAWLPALSPPPLCLCTAAAIHAGPPRKYADGGCRATLRH